MLWTLSSTNKVNLFNFAILVHFTDFQDEYEAVLIKPVMKDNKKPALVVFSHGGPHTAYTLDFSLYIACFCKLGFAILSGKSSYMQSDATLLDVGCCVRLHSLLSVV